MTGYFPEELTNLNVTRNDNKGWAKGGKEKENGLKSEMGSKRIEPCRDGTFHICLQF